MLLRNNHCTFWLLNLQILLFWLRVLINLNCLSIDFLVLNLFWIWIMNIGRSVPQANIDFSGAASLYLILFLLGWCICVGRLTRLIHIRILINRIRSLNMFCVSFGQMFRLIGGYQATVLTLEGDFRVDSWLSRFDIDFCYFWILIIILIATTRRPVNSLFLFILSHLVPTIFLQVVLPFLVCARHVSVTVIVWHFNSFCVSSFLAHAEKLLIFWRLWMLYWAMWLRTKTLTFFHFITLLNNCFINLFLAVRNASKFIQLFSLKPSSSVLEFLIQQRF